MTKKLNALSTPSRTPEYVLIAVLVVLNGMILAFSRSLVFRAEDARYLLSATAQAVAGGFVLTFTVSAIVSQAGAKYGLDPVRFFFRDAWTIVLMSLFIVSIVLPLGSLGVPDTRLRAELCVWSLELGAACWLLVLPYALHRTSQVHPIAAARSLVPRPDSGMIEPEAETALQDLEGTVVSAFKSGAYVFTRLCLSGLADATAKAVEASSHPKVEDYLESMCRLSSSLSADPYATKQLLDAVLEVGKSLARARYFLGIPKLHRPLRDAGRSAVTKDLPDQARNVVTVFLALAREFVEAGKDEFAKLAKEHSMMVGHRPWQVGAAGVHRAWCIGPWKLAAQLQFKNLDPTPALSGLHDVAHATSSNVVADAAGRAMEDMPPDDKLRPVLEKLARDFHRPLGVPLPEDQRPPE
ncbi:MAG: hypothetical protein R6X12_07040 [bacterium]